MPLANKAPSANPTSGFTIYGFDADGRDVRIPFPAFSGQNLENVQALIEAYTKIFTQAEKNKLGGLDSSLIKGGYTTLAAAELANPSPLPGTTVHVDAGVGEDVDIYVWDATDSEFVIFGSGGIETPASIYTKLFQNLDIFPFDEAAKDDIASRALQVDIIKSLETLKGNLVIQDKVILNSRPGNWDEIFGEHGNQITVGNKIIICYTGRQEDGSGTYTGIATSDDNGETWSRSLTFDTVTNRETEDPYIIYFNDTYFLYAEDKQDLPFRNFRGYSSVDLINWIDLGDVLDIEAEGFSSQDVSSPAPYVEDGVIYMFYEGRRMLNGINNSGAIAIATSTDGENFTKVGVDPIFVGSLFTSENKSQWADSVVPDDIIKIGDYYYMSYHGYSNGYWGTGIARSKNLVTGWQDFSDGPKTLYFNNKVSGLGILFYKINNDLKLLNINEDLTSIVVSSTTSSSFQEVTQNYLDNALALKEALNVAPVGDDKVAVFNSDGSKRYEDYGVSQKNISYGESYIANYRNAVLDDGATFFPSDAGYEVGKLKESGVMNDCSLLLLTSAVKAVTLYSVKPQDRTGDFTVDRNSTATYIDEDGLIKTSLANVPRIDYSSGEAALLVELQSTNLYLNSATLATQNISTTASIYTVSFYGTGTITFSSSYVGSLAGAGAAVRVSKTFTATAGTLTSAISGTVTEGQCENLTHPTSYIPTNGTTETRLEDNIYNDTLNYSGDYTIFFEIDRLINYGGGSTPVLKIVDSLGNVVSLYTNGNQSRYNIYLSDDGGYIYGYGNNSSVVGVNKLAISLENDIIKFYVNGVAIGDTYSTIYRGLSSINLLSNQVSKSIFSIKAFKKALTDQQLMDLTT